MILHKLNEQRLEFAKNLLKGAKPRYSNSIADINTLNWKDLEIFVFELMSTYYENIQYYGNNTYSFDFVIDNIVFNVKRTSNDKFKIHQMVHLTNLHNFKSLDLKEQFNLVVDYHNNRFDDETKMFNIDPIHYNIIFHKHKQYCDIYINRVCKIDKDKVENLKANIDGFSFVCDGIYYSFSISNSTLSTTLSSTNKMLFVSLDVLNEKILKINDISEYINHTQVAKIESSTNDCKLKFNQKQLHSIIKNVSKVSTKKKRNKIKTIEDDVSKCIFYIKSGYVYVMKNSKVHMCKKNKKFIKLLQECQFLNENGVFIKDYRISIEKFSSLFGIEVYNNIKREYAI